MFINVAKVRENVRCPVRANPSDAGLDVFFVPKSNQPECKFVQIAPGDSVLLPSGIKVEIPHGYVCRVECRSSLAQIGLIVGATIVDSGYEGEILINLINTSNDLRRIYEGDKIAQLVFYPIILPRLNEVSSEELYKDRVAISERGSGGFGSTDNKKSEDKEQNKTISNAIDSLLEDENKNPEEKTKKLEDLELLEELKKMLETIQKERTQSYPKRPWKFKKGSPWNPPICYTTDRKPASVFDGLG
jgi:dUTP pyrophosphatase